MDVIFARAPGRAWPHLGWKAANGAPVWVVTGGDPSSALRARPPVGLQPRVLSFDTLVQVLHRRLGGRADLLTPAEAMAIAAGVCAELHLGPRLGPDAPSILLGLGGSEPDAPLEPELAEAAALLKARLLAVPGRVPPAAAIDPLRRILSAPTAVFRAWAATLGGLVMVSVAGLPTASRALLLALAEALGHHGVPSYISLRCGRLRGGDDPIALLIEGEEDPSVAPFASERELRRSLVTRALHGDGAVRLRVALAPDSVFEIEDLSRLAERPDPIDAWSEGLAESTTPEGVRAVRCPDGATELDFVADEAVRAVAAGATVAIGVPDVEARADALLWAFGRRGLPISFPEGRALSRWPLVRRFSKALDPAVLDAAEPDEFEIAEEIRRLIATVDAAESALTVTDTQASLFGPPLSLPAVDRRSTLIAALRAGRFVPRGGAAVEVVSLTSLVDHPASHRFAIGLSASDVSPGAAVLGALASLVRDGWYGAGGVVLTWPESVDGRPTHPLPWLTRWFPSPDILGARPLPRVAAVGPPEPSRVTPAGRRLRITAVESYARCPIRWWLRDRLRLEEVREATPEVRADLRGVAAHGLLERFVEAWGPRRVEGREAPALLHRIAVETFAALVAESPAHQAFLTEEKHRWIDGLVDDRPAGLLADWLDHERQLLAGVVPIAVEVPVSLDIDGVELVGRIDRVDRVRDAGLLITDYKTGAAPSLSELRRGLALQMVAYRLALEHGDALADVEAPIDRTRIAASFLELRRPGEVERRGWLGDPELLRALTPARRASLPLDAESSRALLDHLHGVVRRMRAGIVHPTLADPDEVGCSTCPYRAICRHEPTAAHDWVGRLDVQAPLQGGS